MACWWDESAQMVVSITRSRCRNILRRLEDAGTNIYIFYNLNMLQGRMLDYQKCKCLYLYYQDCSPAVLNMLLAYSLCSWTGVVNVFVRLWIVIGKLALLIWPLEKRCAHCLRVKPSLPYVLLNIQTLCIYIHYNFKQKLNIFVLCEC